MIIFTIILTIYVMSVFGAIEMLIYFGTKENEKVNSECGLVFVPILNTIATVMVLILKLLDIVKDFINNRIEINKIDKFKNNHIYEE